MFRQSRHVNCLSAVVDFSMFSVPWAFNGLRDDSRLFSDFGAQLGVSRVDLKRQSDRAFEVLKSLS